MSDTTVSEARRGGFAGRMVRFVTRGPVQIFLVVVGFLWLLPALGLLLSSFRPVADATSTGWWTVITNPTELTIQNYEKLLSNQDMVGSFWNTLFITAPSAILLVLFAALAAYAFAWVRFPGRDVLFLIVVGLLVVPLQVGLIPVARLYSQLGLFGSLPGVWL
ncbi:MAG TPA: carbohydrate ABC transporter permease, partial [Actinomycetota bacterium]|nr:carbohydrate ABC transporter permease [Actinomycetota bacterium]